MVLVDIYRVCTLVLIMFASSYFVGILWYIYVEQTESSQPGFLSRFEMSEAPNAEK